MEWKNILSFFNFLSSSEIEQDKKILEKTIKEKDLIISEQMNLLKESAEVIKSLQSEIKSLNEALIEKDKVLGRHQDLETYKSFLETIPSTKKYYDFGHGRKQVHTIFKSSIQDEEEIRDFIDNILEFDGSKYSSADELVYQFTLFLNKKYKTTRYYASDSKLYGVLEYWATAKETIQRIKDNENYLFDCDDKMTLLFSCLYHLLKDYFPEDSWRLRGFIVDLWSGGGHAILSWVKSTVNDFVPLETTFRDDEQDFIWKEDYKIRNQLFYQIRYSFDEKAEYARI